MNVKIKRVVLGIFAVVMVAIFVVSMMTSDLKHIDDTNGADDYSLTTITDDDIIKCSMGALMPANVQKGISSNVKISSSKFTGVYEIISMNYILPSDFQLDLTSFTVDGGNFKMVVVHNNKIVATLEPGEDVSYRMEDIKGNVSLRIAGESASYSFYMSQMDYDSFMGN